MVSLAGVINIQHVAHSGVAFGMHIAAQTALICRTDYRLERGIIHLRVLLSFRPGRQKIGLIAFGIAVHHDVEAHEAKHIAGEPAAACLGKVHIRRRFYRLGNEKGAVLQLALLLHYSQFLQKSAVIVKADLLDGGHALGCEQVLKLLIPAAHLGLILQKLFQKMTAYLGIAFRAVKPITLARRIVHPAAAALVVEHADRPIGKRRSKRAGR